MAKDVHDALVHVVHKHGEKSENDAEEFIKNLHNKGKYSVDVWS
jgi:sulfite reductase (NADPH) flavoprotein alpha-component